ncbi:uncharacterized protein PV07_04746 [Cladophialophora immunda]|uniref:Transcription factor domain-containing protein n=1 Tax=Cladophialophora immunda TaxID=569365 RepID=A0A0D1ZLQ0_9EURO|nr:uncharacterized protein PV07_04746 [Cladophialophora immunda]KIW28891.1 hypothetical protein PV07_04746 [Cladophialophora immunda]
MAKITGRPKAICFSDITAPTHLYQGLENEASESLFRHDELVAAEQSRSLWLHFLNTSRDLSRSMGAMDRKSIACIGRGISPSYFHHRVLLCRISDRIAAQLYSGTLEDSWATPQRKIRELQRELSSWADNLPEDLAIHNQVPMKTDPRVKVELSMYYYSIQMILYRPCLCEVIFENESSQSREFNRESARACVYAAISLLGVMADNPSAHAAYQLLPFWTLLHYVAPAATVLLLELCLDHQHFTDEHIDPLPNIRKAMAYLWCMTEDSLSAFHAWRIFRLLLSEISCKYEDLSFADIPEEAPQPIGWTIESELSFSRALVS